jgi:acetolactate synthase-1/3 small subunit
MNEQRVILGVLVSNQFGVLTRVAGLFARRGYNIDSLTVGETEDPAYSRMTIVARGDDYMKSQIVKQLEKLYDVKEIRVLSDEASVSRELLLIKICADQQRHAEIMEAVKVYRAKVIDLSSQAITMEITGESDKLDAFVEYLKPYGIAELCRTGVTAISRGSTRLAVPKRA